MRKAEEIPLFNLIVGALKEAEPVLINTCWKCHLTTAISLGPEELSARIQGRYMNEWYAMIHQS